MVKKKQKKKSKQKDLIIPRTAMIGIMSAIPITAILIAKDKIGPMVLFFIGIFAGIFIGKGFFEK